MTGEEINLTRPRDPIGRALYGISSAFAVGGGLVVLGLVLMVVISVTGRFVFSSPVYGDFEMVAMGTAISVFMFLPYCQMKRANVAVDFFLSRAPIKIRLLLDAAGSLLLALVAGFLCWRMALGGVNAVDYHEVTYILAMPIWWAYPFAVLSFALLGATSLYTAYMDITRGYGRNHS